MCYEKYIANMEAARNASCEDYFAARPQLFITIEKEKIYEAAFESAYKQQQEKIDRIQRQNDELVARVGRLESEHKDLVLRNALLRQRPDLPIERLQAYSRIQSAAVNSALDEFINFVFETDYKGEICRSIDFAVNDFKNSKYFKPQQ